MIDTAFVADSLQLPLADQSVDLVFGSPPYCDCRDYGIGACRDVMAWVEWMLDVTTEALRVSRGPVIWVAAGPTRKRNYWPACEGLMWEWFKRYGDGKNPGSMYRPVYWHRSGIPGSGGDQWFRADVETVMCFKRPGKLPYANPKDVGHTPKWNPGGEPNHRMANGRRVTRTHTKRELDGSMRTQGYNPPNIANPGNLIQTVGGGGHLGSKLAHENEAPFPEKLAEFFIRSLCPVGGVVLDPFCGSGTTAAVALAHGRHYVMTDVRQSQIDLTNRRVEEANARLRGG